MEKPEIDKTRSLTVLRVADGKRAAKQWNGEKMASYDAGLYVRPRSYPVPNLDELEKRLRALSEKPDRFVIRGVHVGGQQQSANLEKWKQAKADKSLPKEEHARPPVKNIKIDGKEIPGCRRLKANFEDAGSVYIAHDVDGALLPDNAHKEWLSHGTEHLMTLVQQWVRLNLPGGFHGIDCVVQLSASAGIKSGMNMRLWYELNRPLTCQTLGGWAKGREGLDPSTYRLVQPIYIAAPVITKGADPLQMLGWSEGRVLRCEGLLGDIVDVDQIDLDKAAEVSPEEAAKLNALAAEKAFGDAWEDAVSKPGFQGAFNRLYSVSECIDRWIGEIYTPTAGRRGHYDFTYSPSGAPGSRFLIEDTKLCSNANSDPFDNQPRDAWELVRFWMFEANEEEYPGCGSAGLSVSEAQCSMEAWVQEELPEVVAEMERRARDAFQEIVGDDFDLDDHPEGLPGQWDGPPPMSIYDVDKAQRPKVFIDVLNTEWATAVLGKRAVLLRRVERPDYPGTYRYDDFNPKELKEIYPDIKVVLGKKGVKQDAPDIKLVGDAWKQDERHRKYEHVVYAPDARAGELKPRTLNKWCPPVWQADPGRFPWLERPIVADEIQPFLNLAEHVIPDPEDRKFTLMRLAGVVQRPRHRFRNAVFLVSEENGVGKNALLNCFFWAVGWHNVKEVDSEQLAETNNNWLEECIFANVQELSHSGKRDLVNRLKPIVTEETISVRGMYVGYYQVKNHVNLVFTSNHRDALALDDKDRRFFVAACSETEMSKPLKKEFFPWWENDTNKWLVTQYLLQMIIDWDLVSDKPPMSTGKANMIAESRTAFEVAVDDLLSDPEGVCGGMFVVVGDVVDRIDDDVKRSIRAGCARRAADILRKRGYKALGRQIRIGADNYRKERLWCRPGLPSPFNDVDALEAAEVREAFLQHIRKVQQNDAEYTPEDIV